MNEPVLTRLARWSSALDPVQIPADVMRAARYQVLNMVAAAHAAAGSDEVLGVVRAVERTAGPGGRSTVIATGTAMPPVEAAIANAAASMAHDFDDIVWMGHTGHSSVFAPLAVSEHERATTTEMLTAVVVANEIAGGLGASSFLGPLNGQMWSFIHLIGAAASTSKLLGLDADRTAHAMAIALAQPTFALQPGFMRPSSKLLTASTPTAIGIRAAYMAREGMTGEPTIVEDRRGFWSRFFAFLPLPGLTEDLGVFWVLRTLGIKTFPGCYYFQTACSAIEEIISRRRGLRIEEVASVLIETNKLGIEATRFASEYASSSREISPINIDFDLSLLAAVFLHAQRFTEHEHDPAWLAANTGEIRRWQGRISVRHDPALTLRVLESAASIGAGKKAMATIGPLDLVRVVRRYRAEYRSSLLTPEEAVGWASALVGKFTRTDKASSTASSQPVFPNRVTVRLADGSRESVQLDLPVGSISSPTVEAQLRTKFINAASATLGAGDATKAFELGLRLDSVALGDFTRACKPASSARVHAGDRHSVSSGS